MLGLGLSMGLSMGREGSEYGLIVGSSGSGCG